MSIRKGICLTLALLLALGLTAAGAEERRPRLVATVFPAYDFARELLGEDGDVALLLPPGGDSHSYEPTPQDVIAIQSADLFLYVGGESDAWIERILSSLGADAPKTFALTSAVLLLNEEQTQSMEAEREERGDEAEMDEHVWTSPKNAILIVNALAEQLSELLPGRETEIFARRDAYGKKLAALDAAFAGVAESGKRKTVVFGDRFPFRYFAAAYGLTYDAAFPGCSEDSEPSVKTVASLVDFIRREQIPVVFYIEFSSRKTADILAEETGAKELLFHSCHTVSAQEMAGGASYLSLMQENVEALREALN